MARGKGEGSVYWDEPVGLWAASVALPPDPVTGRRRRKVVRGRTRAEAVRRMRQVQVEVARTGDVPTGQTLTVAGWLEQWLERDVAPVRKPSTTGDYRSAVRVHIVPAIGRRRLDRLTPDDIRAVHRAVLGRGASTTTAAKIHRVLRTALAAAAEAGRFLEARRQRGDYARWATSLLLGARQGEVLGITLDGLHLDAGAPWVELAWEVRRVTWAHGCGTQAPDEAWPCGRRRGADCPSQHAPVPAHLEAEQVHGGLWLLRPKTAGSYRSPGLPAVLAEALAEHIRVHHPTRFLFEASPGIPLDPRRDHTAWHTALAEEGLPPMRLHSARHTTATLLLTAGVPQRVIQEILGQTQALTTARYQHPGHAETARALDTIADPLTRPDPGPV